MGQKATFVLDESTMQQARALVKSGQYKSLTSFVETAIRGELARVRREQIHAAIRQAAADPLFLADIQEVEGDFTPADFEDEQ